MIDFPKELNSEQLEVVLHGDGPCLVLAGAGSGKTRVITYRVAYLLEQGISPENILLVTFTNKAADEMIRRMQSLTGIQEKLPWAGTFHHIAYRILRQYAPLLGYKNNFSVLDSDDSEALLKLCAKPFKSSDGDKRKFPSASILQNIISFSRNSETTVADVLDLKYPQWLVVEDQIKSIADEYYIKKKEANAMDFDDLLTNFLLLLNSDQVLQKYSQQFKYILVDEYQDTNKIQASIIKKLASAHNNLLVVGDDAQSIYSFRAADVQNILQFEKDYPSAKIFKLETNYRSSQEILQLANEVISNNVKQYKKELKTVLQSGLKPSLHPQMDQAGEAEFVAGKILELIENNTPENEIAVLFRAAYHSQMLELELVKAGIAYDYRGGLRFFERAHVKDVLAYLRILNNFADTAAWMRVLMHEEGIGPAAAQKIVEALKSATNVEDVKVIGQQVLGEKAKNGWYNFVRIWEAMLGTSRTDTAALIDSIINSPYKDYLEGEFIDSKDRLEDISQLQVFANKYNELEQFLAEASLQESFNIRGGGKSADQSGPKVVLSTIHQAKGLEWSAVFIINLSSGAFPSDRAFREPNGLEEERRLFYVAITRAKKHLHLTYPMAGGGFGDSMSGPSLFLGEISSDLLDDHSLLSGNGLVLNDEEAGVTYESEDKPLRITPGSFLRSIDDL
ncbi:MAG: DNA helicase II / ATP-dependent DNA helicase PcrA [Parcubacteria group bacterium Gr01-1014_13]|nr:MAG: DNA helicase II / ATP-dependent DNA helicase PcrA [Parcubacteria group bacterium Gr01-1014_13]